MNNHSNSMSGRRDAMLPSSAVTWILGALVLSIFGGCDLLSSGGTRSVAINELIEIDEGDTVRLGQSRAFLTFDDVREDSRCPTGVVCVWAGIADARFSLVSAAGESVFALKIHGTVETPHEENDVVALGNFRFQLLELNPYPDVEQDQTPPQYRALIRAVRDGSAP